MSLNDLLHPDDPLGGRRCNHAWKRMFDYNYGTINKILKLLFNAEPVNWLSYEPPLISLIGTGVLFGMGVNILLYISAIKNIPGSISKRRN